MSRKRDILVFAIRGLHVGEELFCTLMSYARIAPRISYFQSANPRCRFKAHERDGLMHIRRIT